MMDRAPEAVLAVVLAVVGSIAYIVVAERALGLLPSRFQVRAHPWVWLAPAGGLIVGFLVFPALNTLWLSLRGTDSTAWVGLANYAAILGDPNVRSAMRNSAIWVVLFPFLTVSLGLGIALLADRVRYEWLVRSLVFLPMAVSFVAAGVTWRFVYDYRPPPLPQTGTLNAALSALVPGFEPQAWLVSNPPLNNLAIIVAATWVWTGFCMVIFSAGLKGIPSELLEAAKVDGASALQVARHVVIPMLGSTIAVVTTTMVIFALKAFDVVYVMTNGNFDTEVIANRVYKEMFVARDFGRASAVATLLLVAIVPVVVINLRRFRENGTVEP